MVSDPAGPGRVRILERSSFATSASDRQPVHARRLGTMARLEFESGVRLADGAAALDQLVGRRAQLAQPLLVDGTLDQQEAVLEVGLALRLPEDPRLEGENLFRCHAMTPYLPFGFAPGFGRQ